MRLDDDEDAPSLLLALPPELRLYFYDHALTHVTDRAQLAQTCQQLYCELAGPRYLELPDEWRENIRLTRYLREAKIDVVELYLRPTRFFELIPEVGHIVSLCPDRLELPNGRALLCKDMPAGLESFIEEAALAGVEAGREADLRDVHADYRLLTENMEERIGEIECIWRDLDMSWTLGNPCDHLADEIRDYLPLSVRLLQAQFEELCRLRATLTS